MLKAEKCFSAMIRKQFCFLFKTNVGELEKSEKARET